MRNLSNREALVSLLLVALACVASYYAWFAPALAQTERDRNTIERLLATMATPTARERPAAETTASAQAASAPPLTPPPAPFSTRLPRRPPTPKRAQSSLELACANDKDPLCGAFDR